MPAVLSIEKLTHDFGGLRAVSDFSLTMEAGELVGLIGPNGAGKTTVFNLITGVYRPTSGQVQFDGTNLIGQKPHRIAELGVTRTFQTIRLYGDLTALQNVALGSQFRVKYGFVPAILHLPAFRQEEAQIRKEAMELLTLFRLDNRATTMAKNLPYGEQRRLEICRALASSPKLVLLDEPAAGMNPQEVEALMELIQWVHDKFKLTTILIEHQMRVVMGICPRIVAMDFGAIIATGTPKEIQGNQQVIEAYLGKEEVD